MQVTRRWQLADFVLLATLSFMQLDWCSNRGTFDFRRQMHFATSGFADRQT